MRLWLGTAAALLAAWGGGASAAQVQVAVAANMAAPMKKIAADFARATGHEALVALGSTGKFYTQIRAGAPFEVLVAADEATPVRLEREGIGVAGSRFTYATGRLVLWSADPARVDAQGEVLRRAAAGKLAIADPKLAPYGTAAMQTLQNLGVLAAWRPHLVQGENIGQAWQFAATGAAPLGLVALSQVMVDGKIASGSAWIVPARLHAPLKQDALLLQRGQDNPAAKALLDFLQGDAARATLRSYGYDL